MKPVFADTSFYVGLFNPGDVHHEKAVRLARETRRAVVVTEFVLLELANALARASSRKLVLVCRPGGYNQTANIPFKIPEHPP